MKNLLSRLKNMDKHDRAIVILTALVFLLMLIYAIFSVNHNHKFIERINYGNDRWHQVENTLKDYEERIQAIECQLDKEGK